MGLPEKIDRNEWSASYKKYLKRKTRRLRRLEEKRSFDPPKKNRYRGWSL